MSALHLRPVLHEMSDHTLHARMRARLIAGRLDAKLADGADPSESADLAWRARFLLRPHTRKALAKGLQRAVADARNGRPQLSAAIRVARPAVRGCAPSILALAAELGGDGLRPQGVAMTRRLLADGAGPLYCARSAEELHDAIDAIRGAL